MLVHIERLTEEKYAGNDPIIAGFDGFAVSDDLRGGGAGTVQKAVYHRTEGCAGGSPQPPGAIPRGRLLGWAILVLCVLAFAGAFVYGGYDGLQKNYGFWQFFGRFLTMLYLEKAFDIVFFDWFLLTRSHFFQHFYPETGGCEGYRRFDFNRREQFIHIVLYPFLALLAAWICTLF